MLAPGRHRLTVRVDNTVKINVGADAHSITRHTQTNWNGVIGRIELRATDRVWIDDLQVYPDVKRKIATVRATVANATGRPVSGTLALRASAWNADGERTPPEAAFAAADRMGFILHVETPVWTVLGSDPRVDAFVHAETDRILRAYGNHPSFCMLCVGNEPSGRNQKAFLSEIVTEWKAADPRRLYTSCAGWPIIPESDYHSTPALRGQAWGAGLRGRFNAWELSTDVDYTDHVARLKGPIVFHEIGQYCAYPNFREIPKYTGVLRPYNLEAARDSLARNHMLDQADDFLAASGKWQALLYKEEIETALRTPGFGGFQLLDLHDFPGQGTALLGILDAFWDSKGYVTAREHRRYCCKTLPLWRMKKVVWTQDEAFRAASRRTPSESCATRSIPPWPPFPRSSIRTGSGGTW